VDEAVRSIDPVVLGGNPVSPPPGKAAELSKKECEYLTISDSAYRITRLIAIESANTILITLHKNVTVWI